MDEGTRIIEAATDRTSDLTFRVVASSGITGETVTTLEGAIDVKRRIAWFSRPGRSAPDFVLTGEARYERTELSGLDAPTPWVVYTPNESGTAFRQRVHELLNEDLDCDELFNRLTTFTSSGESVLASVLRNLDPLTLLDELRELTAKVERIAAEEVRGVSTTHYRVEFDDELFASNMRNSAEQNLASLPREARECLGSWMYPSGPPPHVDVWIDGADRVRRLEQWQPLEIAPSRDVKFLSRFDLFDFGTPVEVNLPADEDVTPAGALKYPATISTNGDRGAA